MNYDEIKKRRMSPFYISVEVTSVGLRADQKRKKKKKKLETLQFLL